MDIESTVNAEPVGAVDQQPESTNDTSVTETSENNTLEVAEPKQEQTREENSAFAEMRRKAEAAEAKAKQYEKDISYAKKYSNLGIMTEAELREQYEHQGITSWEDVDNYYAAQEKNVDPQMYKEFNEMKAKLSKYENEQKMQSDIERLSSDKTYGELFSKVKDSALEIATKYNVDLETGFTLALKEKANELYKQPDVESIKQQAIKEYIEKVKSGNVPVESSSNGGVVVNSSPKSFEEARKNVFAMLRAGK